MTKAIKFNLTIDKKPVRDLEDLLKNFNLDDLLTAYHNQKSLQRWLEVRGLTSELEKLKAISGNDELEIATALCKLFEANLSVAEINAAVNPIVLRRQQEMSLKQLAEQQFARDEVINKYHKGYTGLCEEMLSKPIDYSFLKPAIDTLWKDYRQLFSVDFDSFFAAFIEKSPLTLFAMLGNEDYRQSNLFTLPRKEKLFSLVPNADDIQKVKKYQKDTGYQWVEITREKVIVKKITDASRTVKIKDNEGNEYMGDVSVGKELSGLHFYSYNSSDTVEYELVTVEQPSPYRAYKGETDSFWKEFDVDKKCLLLKMESGCLVRNHRKTGEELNAEYINKNFVILDGIDYKSNNANHALIYMVI